MRTKADKKGRGFQIYVDVHIVASSADFKNWQLGFFQSDSDTGWM